MNTSPKRAGFSRKRLERITDHLNRNYIDPGKISGCQVAVSRHGETAYFHSFGRMDIENNIAMRDDAIFRIYSMSKPITSIALMQLFERGLFQLNDPVHRFLPAWKDQKVWVSGEGEMMETRAPTRPMRMKDVLTHMSGLSYGATNHPIDKGYRELNINRSKGETLQSFCDKLAHVPLYFQPGERWMYSFSTDVCGHLIEVISGMPLDEYLEEHIFKPLDMKDTAFFVSRKKRHRIAANYERKRDKSLKLIDAPATSTYLEKPTFFSGGGGLTGTTADYLRFCEALRRGGAYEGARIIGRRTLELMTRNFLPGNGDLAALAVGAFSETAYEGVGFGLGFAMTKSAVDTGALGEGDYYWGGAASTIFWVDPYEDLCVVFMTQLMPSATFNFRGQLKNIIYSAIE